MGDTEISWTHRPGTRGRTWNPTQGCSRISAGCQHCYAERMAARFADDGWSQGLINIKTRKWNGVVRLAAHKLADPLRWRQPSTIFVNSMSDLFHENLTNEQIAAVFGVMAAAPQHTFQVLTKRAKRMREWFEWAARRGEDDGGMWTTCLRETMCWLPEHADRIAEQLTEDGIARHGVPEREPWPLPWVWLGVSVENQEAADERIPELLRTPAAVRFLSCEPLIGPAILGEVALHGRFIECPDEDQGEEVDPCAGCPAIPNDGTSGGDFCGAVRGPRIDWVIAGCESGPGARPCGVEWLRSLRDQCEAAGVSFFLKQAQECLDVSIAARGVTQWATLSEGVDSKRKAGGVIELPYLDGVQHAAFPTATPGTP